MDDFAAIDFETANQYRSSVCSVRLLHPMDHPHPRTYDARCGRRAAVSRRMGKHSPTHRRPAPCGPQQLFRRRMPACRIQRIPYGISRIYVPLHLPFRTPVSGTYPARSSVAYGGRILRLQPRQPSSCPGRRRSMCRHRNEAVVRPAAQTVFNHSRQHQFK